MYKVRTLITPLFSFILHAYFNPYVYSKAPLWRYLPNYSRKLPFFLDFGGAFGSASHAFLLRAHLGKERLAPLSSWRKLGNLYLLPIHFVQFSIIGNLLFHSDLRARTLLYTHLVNFESDEYSVKVANSKKEIVELLEAGFEWVGQDCSDLTYFRKRK